MKKKGRYGIIINGINWVEINYFFFIKLVFLRELIWNFSEVLMEFVLLGRVLDFGKSFKFSFMVVFILVLDILNSFMVFWFSMWKCCWGIWVNVFMVSFRIEKVIL